MMLAGGEIGHKYLDGITNTDGYTGFGVVVVAKAMVGRFLEIHALTRCLPA